MITVKRLSPDDVSSLPVISDNAFVSEIVTLKISRSLLSLSYAPLPASGFVPVPSAVSMADALAAGGWVLGAYEDGTYIGSCTLMASPANWLDVADIRVNSANRRHGAAALLISTAFSLCREQGLSGLHITSTDTNPVLCQCCEHLGFSLGGFDRFMYAFTPEERQKPLLLRTCGLHFYKWNE